MRKGSKLSEQTHNKHEKYHLKQFNDALDEHFKKIKDSDHPCPPVLSGQLFMDRMEEKNSTYIKELCKLYNLANIDEEAAESFVSYSVELVANQKMALGTLRMMKEAQEKLLSSGNLFLSLVQLLTPLNPDDDFDKKDAKKFQNLKSRCQAQLDENWKDLTQVVKDLIKPVLDLLELKPNLEESEDEKKANKMMEKIMSVMGPDFDLDGGFKKYMKIRDEKGEDAATEYVGEEVLKAFESKQLPLN